jgi:hypothetical protein
MILLPALLVGYLAGMLRAHLGNRSFQVPEIRRMWLVAVAIIPQILVFFVPATSSFIPTQAASVVLVTSQIGLLLFVWSNRQHKSFWILGLGLGLNLAVIMGNGGLMPVSPSTLGQLIPDRPVESWQIGERFAYTKDVVLPESQIRLSWLADRFVTPAWYPQPTAFSLGDIVIALGVFSLFWQAGGVQKSDRLSSATPINSGRKAFLP